MSLSFPRSTRILVNDTFRPSLVGMSIALLVLVAWGIWFALARTPLYEASTEIQIAREGSVIAKFATKSFLHIRPGQSATITGADGESHRAQVLEVANRSQNRMEPNTVSLYVFEANAVREPPKQVQVQVGQESPLIVLLRMGAGAIQGK